MEASPRPSDSSATMTGPDVEAQHRGNKIPYFRYLIDQAGVTPAVLHHEYEGRGTPESPYVVDFLPDDPYNPMEIARWRKWFITLVQAFATLSVSFSSSAYTGGVGSLRAEMGVSNEVAILGVSLYVLGFAIGPLIWAPLSEIYGRQKLFFGSYLALTAFLGGAAGAPDITTLLVLRFFAGAFGSSPLTNAGGVIADMFSAEERGSATGIFAMAPFLGPAVGPIAGGFLGEAAGWRWVEGMMCIFAGILWIISSLTYPETYAPVLLSQRARKLAEQTGKSYISRIDAGRPVTTANQKLKTAMLRPWVLLFREPIVFITSVYMAIIYGTMYLCFAAFPIVFQLGRGWSPGIGGLPFVGMAVGITFATVGTILDNRRYARISAATGGNAPPEARLPPAILGSVLIPAGMFWFAWTNGPEIHWIVPIMGGAVFGAGIVLVFLSIMSYLVDAYIIYAASALAANSVLRSLFGAAFPLFTSYMYESLGNHWASSVPAFLALACAPFPFLFWKYGAAIRMKCRYASEAALVLQKMRGKHESAEQAEEEVLQEERDAAVAVAAAGGVPIAPTASRTVNEKDVRETSS